MPWTFECLKYEFFLCLTKVIGSNRSNNVSENNTELGDRKYYALAKNIMYRIPISRPIELVPAFVINFSDLTPRLQSEFRQYCELNDMLDISIFLKEIATKFFENIDYAYTHDSVSAHLKVILER